MKIWCRKLFNHLQILRWKLLIENELWMVEYDRWVCKMDITWLENGPKRPTVVSKWSQFKERLNKNFQKGLFSNKDTSVTFQNLIWKDTNEKKFPDLHLNPPWKTLISLISEAHHLFFFYLSTPCNPIVGGILPTSRQQKCQGQSLTVKMLPLLL